MTLLDVNNAGKIVSTKIVQFRTLTQCLHIRFGVEF